MIREFTFEIFSRYTLRGKRHFFRLKSNNGEIVSQSQPYKDQRSVVHIVDRLKLKSHSARVVIVGEE